MRQVTAVCQIQTHKGITGLHNGKEYGHIGLGTRVGLYVGVGCAIELADALDSQTLHLIDHLATTVVASGRITLGIFVGQHRPHSGHHLVAYKIFGGNQLDAVHLAAPLTLDKRENQTIFGHNKRYLVVVLSLKHSFTNAKIRLFTEIKYPVFG